MPDALTWLGSIPENWTSHALGTRSSPERNTVHSPVAKGRGMAATRRRTRLRTSLRRAGRSAGRSFFLTVALVPLLLTEAVSAFFGGVSPQVRFFVLLGLTVAVVAAFWWGELQSIPRGQSGLIESLDQEDLERITRVVTVVSGVGERPGRRPSQQLLDELPNLEVIFAIVCDGDVGQAEALREWLQSAATKVVVHELHTHPSRHHPDQAAIERLSAELAVLDGDGLVVDVSADTKLMTFNLVSAAGRVGLPVTFLASRDAVAPQTSAELVLIQDPGRLFSRSLAQA